MPRQRICIISYSPIKSDGRVLRQIEYLRCDYDLTVIGYGDPPSIAGIDWRLFPPHRDTLLSKIVRNSLQIVGRALPPAYDLLEIARAQYWKARRAIPPDAAAILANDLSALPAAAHAARRTGAKLIFDAHEYSPLEHETRKFKLLETPYRTYLLRKYAPRADASMTVCAPIAERYAREFGLQPIVVMNAPPYQPVPPHPVQPDRIRLIHHGIYSPDRHPDSMIRAVALADRRFELYFMLIARPDELDGLKRLADDIAPGRVFFVPPCAPAEIVSRIAEYDLGFCLIAPSSYNNQMSLSNKFFECVMAGLGVVIGQSPAMIDVASRFGFGCIAASFEPRDLAEALNALTTERIETLRANARAAARTLNADAEMGKVTALFSALLADG
jgi:glycosyltransferase involved in cell wall biosynthesis